jgi:hypothetical protein
MKRDQIINQYSSPILHSFKSVKNSSPERILTTLYDIIIYTFFNHQVKIYRLIMKKILLLSLHLFSTCICTRLLAEDSLGIEMRHSHHHRHHHRSSSDKVIICQQGATGPTGAAGVTGAPGSTGSMGPPGPPGSGSLPQFGSFYSTSAQTIGTGGAIFFENANSGPIGNAFSFTPAPGLVGQIFTINETGYYEISYGIFGSDAIIPDTAIELTLNSNGITGSQLYPLDSGNGLIMSAFTGIFHLGMTGQLRLINNSSSVLQITQPSSFVPSTPVNTSAFINIRFLNPD